MASKTFQFFKIIPCFLLGVASVMDMGATINAYHIDMNANRADYNALKGDWEETGTDLYGALEEYGKREGK